MKLIYVDNNATTAVAPEVLDAMLPFFKEKYCNASSAYSTAAGIADTIAASRSTIARALGLQDPGQVYFTSCATESINTALFGTAQASPSRRSIIISTVEHPAVIESCKELEKRGYTIHTIPVDENGVIDITAFIRALGSDTLLVSIMHANNETGVIFPVEELSRITKETDASILFHTDATQTVGKLSIDLDNELQHVDLLSFSGHKLHAPKGVGALFIRNGTQAAPLLFGGHQESGIRGGTENIPYIAALAKAVELAEHDHQETDTVIRHLRDRLEQTALQRIPYITVNGKDAPRLSNTTNISCHAIEGEAILYQFDHHHICISTGSACSSGSLEPSHVLRAMHVPPAALHGSVRFSLSRYTTEEEIDTIISVFPEIVENLRRLSPFWDKKQNKPRSSDKMA